MTRKFVVVLGARPNVVKLSPVVDALNALGASVYVCATGQHKRLFEATAGPLHLPVDVNLGLMRPNQSLSVFLGRAVAGVAAVLESAHPDTVVTVGDTATGLAAALAAFNLRIPLAHVEAGLRTYLREDPYPEEMNRVLIDQMADYCFAPSSIARNALIEEHIPKSRIWVTGNPCVDSLQRMDIPDTSPLGETPYALVTSHRRENHGKPLAGICEAVHVLSRKYPHWQFVWPVHQNPAVVAPVTEAFKDTPSVILHPPMDYPLFLHYLKHATVVLTDSGTVQEEAATLGTKCVILRRTTERPESVMAGSAVLANTDPAGIVGAVQEIGQRAVKPLPLYGDGKAGQRIGEILVHGTTGLGTFKGVDLGR